MREGFLGMNAPFRWVYIALGWLFVALGAVGAAVPLLPTTPFLLVAAFLFSKGSRRWHDWLLSNRHFGPMIRDWRNNRVIRREAKIKATAAIVSAFSLSIYIVSHTLWLPLLLIVTAASILTFIWTRPSEPCAAGDGGRA